MIQQLVIGVIFIGALSYIGRVIYRSFKAKSNCSTGCAKCNAIDFAKIEEGLKAKNSN